MNNADEASPVQGDVMRVVCPTCNRTKVTWNWVHGQDNRWYHECWECDNVFETVGRVHEDVHNSVLDRTPLKKRHLLLKKNDVTLE